MSEPIDELRYSVHMEMLKKSENAKDAGHSTVVRLGFAVDVALALIQRKETEARKVDGNTSDGYHTFNELYEYRRAYNAALFNEWARQGSYDVHKSWKHSDGEDCFGGGWFIVMAELPTGQISNHYEAEHWDEFDIREEPKANEYDGHTPQEALQRLAELHRRSEGGE